MPRAFWAWKNRYCWNSNVREGVFLSLLKYQCLGKSCSEATRLINERAKKRGEKGISRQSANRYYLLFRDYLYAMLPHQYKFTDVELELAKGLPEGTTFPDGYVTQLVVMAMHQALYNRLDRNDPINKVLLGNTTQETYELLIRQSRSKCGIPIETFCGHMAYVLWISIMKEEQPDKDPGLALYREVKSTMIKHPIGSFEMRTTRLVRG
ncbi:hypothetical protein [Kordiimonas aquimaris]|uniref:hypothetical protein n=1 Tax=Kordiimonas aquimaris TaxID=707591 RepID=UPI0021D097C1|nr:hypothetical protein [Kordiimonas aquimaris]